MAAERLEARGGSYYTKYYRTGYIYEGSGARATCRRSSFGGSILSHLRCEQNLPPLSPTLSAKTFHSPSALVSHLPLFTFTHFGLSIARGIVSYMCNVRRAGTSALKVIAVITEGGGDDPIRAYETFNETFRPYAFRCAPRRGVCALCSVSLVGRNVIFLHRPVM